MHNLIEEIEDSVEYKLVTEFYGKRTAKRSGVPLMNHINEGVAVLEEMNSTVDAMLAFCLHPLIQDDADLEENIAHVSIDVSPTVIALAMEYRSVANEYLPPKVGTGQQIRLSPLEEVNDMLVADKVQNRKDFYTYHWNTHENRDALKIYFDEWLIALDVDNEMYINFCDVIEAGKVHESEDQRIKREHKIYESVFHKIQMCSVGFQGDKIREIVGKICDWSYAHRSGNGELSDREQQERIDSALDALEKKIK
jgi:hypothetical protein